MNVNDVIYFSSLLICLSLGSHYKEIAKTDMKRNYGAGLGLLVAFLICGHYILHTFIMVCGNVLILKSCDRRYVHQISLAYSWTYLLYIHHNVPSHSYMIGIFQIIALRLVGLACELSIPEKPRSNYRETTPNEAEVMPVPEAVDILAYAYYFIGIHKGTYYRWRIFQDHLNAPFSSVGDCRIVTEEKIKKAILCAVGYMMLRSRFNTHMYEENRFYTHFGTDYRYLFNIPLLLMFYLNTEMIALLGTAVCTESGFGLYPVKCAPLPGSGPSTHYSVINLITKTPDAASEQEYNVQMLNSFEIEKLILGPKMKDTMRGWDMSIRYWYWAYAYRKFIKANKQVRSAFSFMLWTLWCGPSIPQIIISTTLWVIIHLESEYSELYDTEGSMKLPWDIGFSIMRMFCLLYLTPCFVVDDTGVVLRYYNSIYWMFHIILFVLMFIAVIIFKSRGD
ncbi:lysophospholipid acyltransferase 7 [Papilio machaon]|uniref:lysophospholipid acyltransferase 7 n=1 Tax=Papilio machaon TaxID=76193 RepID=UPI001E663191|nr:lysophospholipid acyltransferase 7 [Papilio machaon]